MSGTPSRDARVTIFSEPAALRHFLKEVRCLRAPTGNAAPSLTLAWLENFLRAYGAQRQLAITLVHRGDEPDLLVPFQVSQQQDMLEFTCDETADYSDIFCSPQFRDEDLELSLTYWAARGTRVFSFPRLPEDSQTIEYLRTVSHRLGWNLELSEGDTIPVLEITDEVCAPGWAGQRATWVKRYRRKLGTLGSRVRWKLLEDYREWAAWWPQISQMHIARWEKLGATSKYLTQERPEFIQGIMQDAYAAREAFVPVMFIDGKPAAFIIGFLRQGIVFDWNTSFDVNLGRYSPGALLLLEIFGAAKRLGITRYNFLRGTEAHKFVWTKTCQHTQRARLSV